ncbi:hypothetical protein IKQ26_09390 [bacterium]|nr:hypothetical protein [bacterium]
MKKIILLVLIIFFMPLAAFADFLPHNVKSIKYYGIGVLNRPESFIVYSRPDFKSPIIKKMTPDTSKNSSIISSNINKNSVKDSFIALRSKEKIAFLTVETAQEDGWYEVYISQKKGEKGWVYDENQKDFYTWKWLFDVYGKTTGLRFMHGVPDEIQTLYASDSFDSQIIKFLEYPSKVTFSMIKGNWMLVTAREYDGSNNIGWLKWRNDDGSLNLFPML